MQMQNNCSLPSLKTNGSLTSIETYAKGLFGTPNSPTCGSLQKSQTLPINIDWFIIMQNDVYRTE